jgi:hypothetical protein
VITSKQDWFTKELEDAGVLVGGGESIAEKLLLDETQVTFRFATSPDSSWMHFLTVGFGQQYSSTYEKNIFAKLSELGVRELFPDLKILFYSDHRSGSFRIHFGHLWESVSAIELQKKFFDVDPSFIGQSGNVKPINKSVNDLFQLWSRSYLNPYCVVNDVDALVTSTRPSKIIELKRPVETISDWKPYRNDLANYQRSKELASITKSNIVNIAYNLDRPTGGQVQIFTIPEKKDNSAEITYSKIVTNSKEAIEYILDRNQLTLVSDSSQR